MKRNLAIAGALFAGGVIGAGLTGTHAQVKAPAFSIAEVEVINPDKFQAFATRNAAGVQAAGGRFIVRRGRVATSAGTPPAAVFLIAWDSLDQATSYFASPTFRELIPLRDEGGKVRLFHVEGLPK